MTNSSLPDPEKTDWYRLYLFWQAYKWERRNLLKKWHNDAAQIRRPGPGQPISTGNLLYDSFLDTWGAGNFEAGVDLKDKTYFQAVDHGAMDTISMCLRTLAQILKTDDRGEPIDPPELTKTPEEANRMAREVINPLKARYSRLYDTLHNKVDPTLIGLIGGDNDPYLKALLRQMEIETESLKVLRDFLETGRA